MAVQRTIDIELTVPSRREAAGPLPPPSRPAKIEVDRDATLGELIDAALHQCHAHLLANRRAARSVDDPEGVHQLRVATRRARSALVLFRGAVADAPMRALRRELRWLGGALAPARDWDVFCVETLPEIRGALPDAPGLRRLCWESELRRLVAHEKACDTLDSDRFAYLLLRLDRTVRGAEWRDGLSRKQRKRLARPARKPAAKRLDARFAEVRLLDAPIAQLTPDALHALRIATKRLRYATEFLAPVYPRRASRRFARRLRGLQDVLGRLNDGHAADGLVDDLLDRVETRTHVELARAAGLVSGWSHRRAVDERSRVEQAWLEVAGSATFWR